MCRTSANFAISGRRKISRCDMHFPTTDYIIALMRHPDLGNACPTKAAQHYGLREDITRYYLDQEKHRRQSLGIPHKPA